MKEKQRGFFMIANDIFHHLPQIGPIGFLIYCILRRMTDRNDRCYPSVQTLSRITGVEEAQLNTALDRLEALQLQAVSKRWHRYRWGCQWRASRALRAARFPNS